MVKMVDSNTCRTIAIYFSLSVFNKSQNQLNGGSIRIEKQPKIKIEKKKFFLHFYSLLLFNYENQGVLAEGERSVRLTSSH